MNNDETSYFLYQIVNFKKIFFHVSLVIIFYCLWRPPKGPGQLPSLPSLKSGPVPGNERSLCGRFVPGNESACERNVHNP